jgi:hypothetical protein
MRKTTKGTVIALAFIGASTLALADGIDTHQHRQGPGAAKPAAESAKAKGHGEHMGARMAEMHARMSERHGAGHEGAHTPREGQAPRDGKQGHSHGDGAEK